jgi:hypothetical protein
VVVVIAAITVAAWNVISAVRIRKGVRTKRAIRLM